MWPTLAHHVGPLAFGFPAEKGEIISFQPYGGEHNAEESGRSRLILASGLGCGSVGLYKAWVALSKTTEQQSPLPSPSLCLMCDLGGIHQISLSLRLPTIKWRSHVKPGELRSTAGDMDGDLVSPGEFYGLSRTNKISAKHPT